MAYRQPQRRTDTTSVDGPAEAIRKLTVADATPPSGALLDPVVTIDWKSDLPTPTLESEYAIIPTLLPGRVHDWKSDRYEGAFFPELSQRRQLEITAAATKYGLSLKQAVSLRTQVYHGAAPWKFEGNEKAVQAAAEQLEDDVGRFLTSHGVRFKTQADLHREAKARFEQPRATPDFLITSHLLINGKRVRWLEVKRFFGSGAGNRMAHWAPVRKCPAQCAKYISAFGGEGALLFLHGHGAGFTATMPPGVQLLDPSPFAADVLESPYD